MAGITTGPHACRLMTRDGLQDGGADDVASTAAHPLDLAARAAVVRALDHGDIQPLIDVLHRMPLALARCLKAANSPHFGKPRQVATPASALEVLGGRSAAMIVLAASHDHGAAGRWSPAQEALRTHDVRMAVLAAQLCHSLGRGDLADLAYVAALLHDVPTLREWRLPGALLDAVLAIEPAGAEPSAADAMTGNVLRVAHRLADRVCEPVRATVEEIDKHAAALHTSRSVIIGAMRLACARIHQLEG